MSAALGREQIEEILPHRDPFLFLDEVTVLEPGSRVVARKLVQDEEWFLTGHFPGRPIMPGVMPRPPKVQQGQQRKQRRTTEIRDREPVPDLVPERFQEPVR